MFALVVYEYLVARCFGGCQMSAGHAFGEAYAKGLFVRAVHSINTTTPQERERRGMQQIRNEKTSRRPSIKYREQNAQKEVQTNPQGRRQFLVHPTRTEEQTHRSTPTTKQDDEVEATRFPEKEGQTKRACYTYWLVRFYSSFVCRYLPLLRRSLACNA